jgi:type I restriction enzyme S subunit
MKDSGVEWIGEIPDEWEWTRLKYRVKFNRRSLAETTSPAFEFKYCDIGTVGRGRLIGEPELMQFGSAPSRARRIVEDGDTIISTVRTYLRAVINFREGASTFVVSTGFAVLSPDDPSSSNYVGWICQSDILIEEVVARSVGVSYPAISPSDIGNIFVSFPPLPEQQAIAAYLDRETTKIDDLVSKKQRLIELLDERRASLISHAVTKGLDPDAPMNDSGIEWIGEVPETWSVVPLKRAFRVTLGKMLQNSPSAPSDRLSPYLKASNIGERGTAWDAIDEMYFSQAEANRLRLSPFEILVVEGGATAGLSGLAGPLPLGCCFQNSLNRIQGTSVGINEFLIYYSVLIYSSGVVDLLCNTSTFTHFTKEKVENVPIPLPPLPEQQAIAAYLDQETAKIDKLKELTKRQIAQLSEKRQALITEAVTGKIQEAREVA